MNFAAPGIEQDELVYAGPEQKYLAELMNDFPGIGEDALPALDTVAALPVAEETEI